MYRHHQSREHTSLVEKHLIIGCDSNVNAFEWGNTDTNTIGESLLRFPLSNNHSTLTIGSQSIFLNRINEEVVDGAICTEGMLSAVNSWCTLNEPPLSDHTYIIFSLGEITTKLHTEIIGIPTGYHLRIFQRLN